MDEIKDMQKDAMTGAYTREHLLPTLKRMIIDANLRKERLSILLVDIDHFKQINEKYGHLWGDHFLRFEIATLRSTLQKKGLVFRYGGDEFVVIFSSPDPKEASLLAKQFNLVMEKRPFLFEGRLFKITVSCGLATYPDDAKSAEDLLKIADEALYFSKRSGRNTTTLVSKIGFYKIKTGVFTSLKILVIAGCAFFLYSYLFRADVQKAIKKSVVNKLLSSVFKTDTKIILKDGTTIKGHIVIEDGDNLIVVAPVNKEDTRIILKNLKFGPD